MDYDVLNIFKISSGRAKEEKSVEAGPDWRPLWRQNNRPGQTLHVLREPGLEGVQVSPGGGGDSPDV